MTILGLVLAGGRARRFGGDKAFAELRGRPLIAHAIDALQGQVDALAVNANRDTDRLAAFGLPVVSDPLPGDNGPLNGVLAGLTFAADSTPAPDWLITLPVDTVAVPGDFVTRLLAAAKQSGAPSAYATAEDGGHYLCAAFRSDLRDALSAWLDNPPGLKVDGFLNHVGAVAVPFADETGALPAFFNINSPDDLARAEQVA